MPTLSLVSTISSAPNLVLSPGSRTHLGLPCGIPPFSPSTPILLTLGLRLTLNHITSTPSKSSPGVLNCGDNATYSLAVIRPGSIVIATFLGCLNISCC